MTDDIPCTPESRDRGVPILSLPPRSKETRRIARMRDIIKTESSANWPIENPPMELPSELPRLSQIAASLNLVLHDLAVEPQYQSVRESLDAELDNVTNSCLTVKRYLDNPTEVTRLAPEQSDKIDRRYPLRRRSSLKEDENLTKGERGQKRRTNHKGIRKITAPRSLSKEIEASHSALTAAPKKSEGSGSENDARHSVLLSGSGTMENIPSSSPPVLKSQRVSLQQVIAALQKEKRPYTKTVPLSLPPLPECILPENVQSSAMEVSPNWPSVKEDTKQERSSSQTEVYVMPSGYIVQSVQLVLDTCRSEKQKQTIPSLIPFVRPESYTLGNSPLYTPVWSADVTSTACRFMELDVRLSMTCVPPSSKLFVTDRLPQNIDVTCFLAELENGFSSNCCHIIPEETSGSLELQKEVHELLLSVQDHEIDYEEEDAGDHEVRESCQKTAGVLSIEERLNAFAQRIDKFYDVIA